MSISDAATACETRRRITACAGMPPGRGIAPRSAARRRHGRVGRWTLALSLLGVAAGVRAQDAPLYSSLVLAADTSSAAPGPGKAMVLFVRELSPRRDALPDEAVMIDDEAAGLLRQGTWFARQVEPGRHVVWGVHQGHDLVLECRPDRRYLVRLREIIDEKDNVVRDWLRDDPEGLQVLVKRYGLMRAMTMTDGLAWIHRRRRSLPHAELSSAPAREPSDPAPWPFEHMLSERPLDRMNLETDFSHLSGRLVIDSGAVHYRLRERVRSSFTSWAVVTDSFDIPISQLVRIRLGGMRFTGVTPWVDLVYHTPQGPRIASFGDFEESTGITTYNRLFAVLEDRLSDRRAANAGSAERPR